MSAPADATYCSHSECTGLPWNCAFCHPSHPPATGPGSTTSSSSLEVWSEQQSWDELHTVFMYVCTCACVSKTLYLFLDNCKVSNIIILWQDRVDAHGNVNIYLVLWRGRVVACVGLGRGRESKAGVGERQRNVKGGLEEGCDKGEEKRFTCSAGERVMIFIFAHQLILTMFKRR